MKALTVTIVLLTVYCFCQSQTAEQYYTRGMDAYNNHQLEESIRYYKLALVQDKNHQKSKDALFKALSM